MPCHSYGIRIMVVQEIPNLLAWVRFLHPVLLVHNRQERAEDTLPTSSVEGRGRWISPTRHASVDQRLDRHPVTVEVAGSNPVSRAPFMRGSR